MQAAPPLLTPAPALLLPPSAGAYTPPRVARQADTGPGHRHPVSRSPAPPLLHLLTGWWPCMLLGCLLVAGLGGERGCASPFPCCRQKGPAQVPIPAALRFHASNVVQCRPMLSNAGRRGATWTTCTATWWSWWSPSTPASGSPATSRWCGWTGRCRSTSASRSIASRVGGLQGLAAALVRWSWCGWTGRCHSTNASRSLASRVGGWAGRVALQHMRLHTQHTDTHPPTHTHLKQAPPHTAPPCRRGGGDCDA